MARGITVKIAKDKVVKALKAKVADNDKVAKSNQAKRDKYAKDLTKHSNDILKSFGKDLTITDVSYYNWRGTLTVNYKVSDGTVIPEAPALTGIDNELHKSEIDEINNAIRLLEMSDEEFVSTSTMKQIAQYL